MSVDAAQPLLGVAGSWGAAEIVLARRFDELHQLIYRRGGLRSSNAAVEEVAKLVLIRLWSLRTGIPVTDHSAAFAQALNEPSLLARDPAGARHPIWPLDEPFRLIDAAVLAGADRIVTDILADPVGDPLGTAFDALLAGRYDHTGGLGTYLTPSGVARMMATDLGTETRTVAPAGSWLPSCPPCTTRKHRWLGGYGRRDHSALMCPGRRWPRPESTCCSTA